MMILMQINKGGLISYDYVLPNSVGGDESPNQEDPIVAIK